MPETTFDEIVNKCRNEYCTPIYGREWQEYPNMAGFDIEKKYK